MTSVDLSWVRDTFADRALIIPLLPRIKDGTPTDESDHHQELLDGRDALMTEMLGRCHNILIAQQEQDSYKAHLASSIVTRLLRMGNLDFGGTPKPTTTTLCNIEPGCLGNASPPSQQPCPPKAVRRVAS